MFVKTVTIAMMLAMCSAVHVTVLSTQKGVIHSSEQDIILEQISGEHLADVYARVAANTPLSAEADVNLPTRDIFAPQNGAVVVELTDRIGA